MKKVIMNLFKVLFYFVFCAVLAVVESIKYVFTGKRILGKLGIIGLYAGYVLLALYKPVIFVVMLALLVLIDLLVVIYMTKSMDSDTKGTSSEDSNGYRRYSRQKIPFFDGLSLEEAKKEYRRLMKQYHPDNAGGDLEMSQKISAAYNQYCATCGR